jgi:hypothetical protein
MKITDDCRAKYRLWAENPRIVPAGTPAKLPRFQSRKLSSHKEKNAWKESLLRQAAQLAQGQ